MSFDKAWPFQQFINDQIELAFPGLPVFAYLPPNAPDRYVRIDGFTISPTQAYKNRETARHGVTVHVIDAPEQGTNSLAWVKQTMATIAVAITDLKLDTVSEGLRPEMGESRFEQKRDKVQDAHAFVRFTARIR